MPAWSLRSISKTFRRGKETVQALAEITLKSEPGEFVVVFGPQGSGKTTLLRILAGLETPDMGEVFMGSHDYTHVSPELRETAMVSHPLSVYPHLTVLQNLIFGLNPQKNGIAPAQAEVMAKDIAGRLGMEDKLGRYPATLSGGEQQRVALARCLIRRPKLFLFDEPLVKLDAKLRENVRGFLLRVHRETGIPMVYATHDENEAMYLADKLVVMDKGRILQVGSPQVLYQKPNQVRVAQLLGNPPMNFFSVTQAAELGLVGDTSSIAAIRPEHFNVVGDENGLGRITTISRMGRNEILQVEVKSIQLRAICSSDSGFVLGQRVTLQVDESAVLWLRG
jgi:multiple sugar transport system ATP-binding protein